jgi:hypothetical protein
LQRFACFKGNGSARFHRMFSKRMVPIGTKGMAVAAQSQVRV